MIDRIHGEFYGECDCCGKYTDYFDTREDCKDWIKENWRIKFNYETQEWEHFCDRCKEDK